MKIVPRIDERAIICPSVLVYFSAIKGGIVKFLIIETERSTTKYRFNVNAGGYKNIYNKLMETK